MARLCGRTGNIIAALAFFAFALATLGIFRSPPIHILEDIQETSTSGKVGLYDAAPVSGEDEPPVNTTSEVPQPPATPTNPPSVPAFAGKPFNLNDFVQRPPDINELLEGPAANGANQNETSKIVVMGKLSNEDTDWVAKFLGDWQNRIYVVDLPHNATSPTGHQTKMNKAKEAFPYLTYIVENYPNFPDVVAFLHSHRKGYPQAWHNDARDHDAVLMLRQLQLDFVRERGYVNLRCIATPGCPDEIRPFRDPPDPKKHAEHAYAYVYADFFNLPLSTVRKQIPVVAAPCCAQFAVSRKQILQRPKQDYEHYLNFLEQTQYDDDTIGRVLEYMWHIIFGQEAVSCPRTASSCACEVFGRCRKNRLPPGRPSKIGP